jgi:pimeloyl-ACP methyl ester carboxylesterase
MREDDREAMPHREHRGFANAPDGTRLFYRHADHSLLATEAPLHAVLTDGILCDGFIWKYLWDQLADRMPVTHWHYPGHGRSARPADENRVGIPSLAEDLHAVVRATGNAHVVLFGHSMGVQVSLEAYHLAPGKVRGLVLFCGSFGKVTSSFRGVPILDVLLPKLTEIAKKSPHLVRALWSRIPADAAMKMARKAGDVDASKIRDEDMLPYLQHMTHVDFPLFLRMLRGAGEHTAEDYLAEVDVPVLVIAGEKDTFTPASLSEHMAKRMPKAKLVVVASGSHAAPIEQPELVFEHVSSFLDSLA